MPNLQESGSLVSRYQALARVSEALRRYHDRDALMRGLARELRPVVQFSFLGLALVDDERRRVEPLVLEASEEPVPPPELNSDDQLTFWVLDHQQPLVIPSIANETRFAEEMRYLLSQGATAACCLPLITPRRRVGMLIAGSRQPHDYVGSDVTFLSLAANQVALAIDDAVTYSELQASLSLERERVANLEMLEGLLAALTGALDVRLAFERISAAAQSLLRHDMVSLLLVEPDRRHFKVHAVTGTGVTFPESVPIPPFLSFLLTEPWEYFIRADLLGDPRERELPPAKAGYRSLLSVPIRLNRQFIGGLDFYAREPGQFTEAHVRVARRIADHVALALSHERLAEAARETSEATDRAARLERRVTQLSAEVRALGGHRRVVGDSPVWKQVLTRATQVAATDTTVLLLGESGTGKEVIARFIHQASARAGGPFVAINCAALPEQLLESEIFGYERGAFTGALAAKPGQLELAASGVLFLDEVSEMSPTAQAKFLRVLQEREFQRLGGTRVLRSNVRIVAATNRDLAAAVARGSFRDDLFYRLNVFEIALPPLRERPEDVLPLSQVFLQDVGRELGRPPAGISHDAREQLVRYHWPGNVRQLRNALERAAILCEGGLITSEHLALPERDTAARSTAVSHGPSAEMPAHSGGAERDLRRLERVTIENALREAEQNKSRAARMLGLSRTQLYVRLRRHGLS